MTAAVVLGSSIFCSVAQHARSRSRADISANADVEAAYKAYLCAGKDKDYTALSRVLSDDHRAVNFKGTVSTKGNEIASAKEDRDYETLTADVMSATVFAECAIASGLIDASWKDERGRTQLMTFRFLAMMQKQKGGVEAGGNAIGPI